MICHFNVKLNALDSHIQVLVHRQIAVERFLDMIATSTPARRKAKTSSAMPEGANNAPRTPVACSSTQIGVELTIDKLEVGMVSPQTFATYARRQV